MNKRYFIASLVGISIFGLGLTSCEQADTVLSDEQKVQQIASVVQSGTQLAVSAVVMNNPDTKKHFETVVVALKAAVGADNLSPDEVLETVKSYLANDPSGAAYYPLIESGVALALSTYKNFYVTNLDQNVKPYLKTLLGAIQQGIALGVGQPAVASGGEPVVNPMLELTIEDLKL